MNVYIGGDKQAAFTSKTAIKKFKNELKKKINIVNEVPNYKFNGFTKKIHSL